VGQVRVRAVANVMGLRRGDEGDVETGGVHVDAMINAGYLEVIEYLPDPIPVAPFAYPNLPDLPAAKDGPSGWVEPAPDPEEVDNGKRNSSKSKPAASRRRSSAPRRPARNTGDGQDVQSSVSDSASGHGEPASPAPDEQAGGEA
jgi:hypothetical protein